MSKGSTGALKRSDTPQKDDATRPASSATADEMLGDDELDALCEAVLATISNDSAEHRS